LKHRLEEDKPHRGVKCFEVPIAEVVRDLKEKGVLGGVASY